MPKPLKQKPRLKIHTEEYMENDGRVDKDYVLLEKSPSQCTLTYIRKDLEDKGKNLLHQLEERLKEREAINA